MFIGICMVVVDKDSSLVVAVADSPAEVDSAVVVGRL